MTKLTAIVAAALLAAPLFAQGPEGRRGPRTPDALVEYLQLSESQVAALQENNQAMREATREILSEARGENQGVREELRQDNPNPAVVGQALVDAKAVREEVKAKRAEFRATAMAILTPEQHTALAALQQVLDLAPTASQAVGFNLLAQPEGRGGPRGLMAGKRGGPGGFRGGPRR